MSKKILINGVTLNEGNITPLLLKASVWQKAGAEISFLGDKNLEHQIRGLGILKHYNFVYIRAEPLSQTRFGFIFKAIQRNFFALKAIRNHLKRFDVIYSISSVLDMILLPFFLKRKNKNLIWATVFDNTVPLLLDGKIVAGNKMVRLLAWFFYQISLILLKSADIVFVIKPELRQTLLKQGFQERQLVLTGNGVEGNLIRRAKPRSQFSIDALYIGRINEAKGIYDMLRVMERVVEKYPNFQLALMGRGDAQTESLFKEKIHTMGLERNIQFLGYRTGQEKFDIIKSSKVFLFLSETESVPIAPLEAVCSGLKTLVYDLDAYTMYKNGEVVVFKKNDWNAVAQKVLEIFEKNDFSNAKGELLLDAFNWDKIAQKELSHFNV